MRLALAIWLVAWSGFGASYFVDFSAGNDANNGTSTATPWKHCPQDGNATGNPAVTTLSPGDLLTFKGGVVYTPTSSLHTRDSGTALAPITIQGSSVWGTGRAIIVGTNNANTNVLDAGWEVTGQWTIVSGFEIRDCFGPLGVSSLGVGSTSGNNCVLSNNFIHRIGIFPWTSMQDSTYGGQGIALQNCSNIMVVSNILGDINYNGFGGAGGTSTNVIIWGNEVYGIQNHGMQFWSRGVQLVAGNFFHDITNGFTHSDAIQQLSIDANGAYLTCFNYFSNNVDDINIEISGTPHYSAGPAYVWGNVFDNSVPGAGGTSGWNNSCKISTDLNFMPSANYWNNTFINRNGGWGSLLLDVPGAVSGQIYITNLVYLNNIVFSSLGGVQWSGYSSSSVVSNVVSDYNVYTNTWRMNKSLPGSGNNLVDLPTFQASFPLVEQHSVQSPISFVNNDSTLGSTTGNFMLASGSSGIASGTNLANVFNVANYPFNAVPAAYRVDPAYGFGGLWSPTVARTARWDAGSYVFTASLPPIAGLCCH